MKKYDYQSAVFETVLALDSLINAFIKFLPSYGDKYADRILEAARSNSDEWEDLPNVLWRVAIVMNNITYEFSGDVTNLVSVRKKVEELKSILHIARSYPDNAVKRAKKIAIFYKK